MRPRHATRRCCRFLALGNEDVTLELVTAGEARSKLAVHRDRVVAHSEYIDNLESTKSSLGLSWPTYGVTSN